MTTDLADRYGTRKRPRWIWIVVTAVGVAAGAAWAAWIALQPTPLGTELFGYNVLSDTEISLSLEIVRDNPADEVICSVYAQADDHSIVGEKTVTIPPGENTVTRHEVTLTTTDRAVTGEIRSCEVTS